jgi:hypothetical protein
MTTAATQVAPARALSFHNVSFDVVDRDGHTWLRGPQLADALGYAQANRVNDLYTRNASEFTDSMTALVTLETSGGPQQVRIFSLRGAHLLGMFARTRVAAEYRHWLLDLIEREDLRPAIDGAPFAPAIHARAAAGDFLEACRTAARTGAPLPDIGDDQRSDLVEGLLTDLVTSSRWMLSFDWESGRPRVASVPQDAMIVPAKDLPARIREGAIPLELLPEIIGASMTRLSAWNERQAKIREQAFADTGRVSPNQQQGAALAPTRTRDRP